MWSPIGPTHTIAVSAFVSFTDPDGDMLTFSVTSSNPAVVGVSYSGSVIEIKAISSGSCQMIITANDGRGGITDYTVTINVP